MTPDDDLGRKAMQMLERAVDAGLAASPDEHELLRIGYDAANQLLNSRLVAPGFSGDSLETGENDEATGELSPRMLHVDPLTLEVGARWAAAAESANGSELLDALREVRRGIVAEYGVITPGVRVRPRREFGDGEYEIVINGDTILHGDAGDSTDLEALCTTVEDTITSHLHDFLTREEVAELLNIARQDAPMVVQELVPNMLALGQLRQVLQHLVRERVSIRNLPVILNALADNAVYTKDPHALAEHVRSALSRRICARYESPDGVLCVIQLHPDTERAIQNSIQLNETGQVLILDPNTSAAIARSLTDVLSQRDAADGPALIVTIPKIRRHVRSLLLRTDPGVVVLGQTEIEPGIAVKVVGTIDAGDLARPMPPAVDTPPDGESGDVGSMRW